MVTRLKACRPSTFLQRSHRIRSRTCYGSRTARAAEQLAHLFSTLEPSAASTPECCCKVKMDAPAAPACVVCLTSDLDSCTAKDRGRARIESSWSGAAVREDERCTRSRQYFRPIPLWCGIPHSPSLSLLDPRCLQPVWHLPDASAPALARVRVLAVSGHLRGAREAQRPEPG